MGIILIKVKNRLFRFFHRYLVKIFFYEKLLLYSKRFSYSGKLTFNYPFEMSFDASSSTVELSTGIIFRSGCIIVSGNNGKLIIGKNNFFNRNCSINSLYEIIIGENNQFGESVKMYDHNHQYHSIDKQINQQGYSTGSIRIGNNCWIGSNVVILKNVVIGDNVVVGAGCIIHQSIPSNNVVINKQDQVFKSY